MKSRIMSFAAAAAATAAASATPAHANDFQSWLAASAKTDIGKSLVLQDEIVARISNDRRGLYEIENSLLLGYKISKKTTVWAGYVHNPNYDAGDFTVMEHRAREQVTVDNFAMLGKMTLSGRLRMEQRWRDGVDGTGWRARPYLKLSVPLGGKAAPMLNLTEEAFVNLNNTSFQSKDGLERLRTAATLSAGLTRALKVEAGYLNQHRFVSGRPDTDDHVLTASVSLSF